MRKLSLLLFFSLLISCSATSKRSLLQRSIASVGTSETVSCLGAFNKILVSSDRKLFRVKKLFDKFSHDPLNELDARKYRSYLESIDISKAMNDQVEGNLEPEYLLAMITKIRTEVTGLSDDMDEISISQARKLRSALDKLIETGKPNLTLKKKFQAVGNFLKFWEPSKKLTRGKIHDAVEEINKIIYPIDVSLIKSVDSNKLYRHLTVTDLTSNGLESFFRKNDLLKESAIERFFRNGKSRISLGVLVNLPVFLGWPPLYVPKVLDKTLSKELVDKIIRDGYLKHADEIAALYGKSAVTNAKLKKIRGYILTGIVIWDLYLLAEFIHETKKDFDLTKDAERKLAEAEKIEERIDEKLNKLDEKLERLNSKKELEGNCNLIQVCLDITEKPWTLEKVSDCRLEFDYDNSCELTDSEILDFMSNL